MSNSSEITKEEIIEEINTLLEEYGNNSVKGDTMAQHYLVAGLLKIIK